MSGGKGSSVQNRSKCQFVYKLFSMIVGTDERGRALGFAGLNFCPGIRFLEVNFAQALGF